MSAAIPTVFVVDDDRSVRESLELLIDSAGWRPQTFASAQALLAHRPVAGPSCLILDLNLPDLNGLDLQKRVAADRLRYSFTVEAPSAWDRPWGGEYEMETLRGQVYEFACHEGNYALRGILSGAREEEKRAARSGASGPAHP